MKSITLTLAITVGIDGECMKINFENVSGFIIKKDMWSFEKVIPQKLSSLSHFQKNEKLFALDKIIDKSSNNNFELFNNDYHINHDIY